MTHNSWDDRGTNIKLHVYKLQVFVILTMEENLKLEFEFSHYDCCQSVGPSGHYLSLKFNNNEQRRSLAAGGVGYSRIPASWLGCKTQRSLLAGCC